MPKMLLVHPYYGLMKLWIQLLREKGFEVVFADKKSNSTGLQLADLMARPIGMSVLKPGQPNRAFEAVKPKFLQHNGRFMGWGLKCFP